ncbi:septal ring lytic transglycosylase RlpA family protein [Paracraurococcus ruber]|uniref:RlpA-like protein double-psi beta-barrel domain-containing protein n=1 Tax=Paracraurococcus ruber TaxID=77675 RepID=A0ABS1D4Q6_9PROT|nr:septal ring lytic transglycosylase RlpA family protein [Paracraurococcus ruber]MBK1661531.1 hypothetical protein [Paracraurococcus ruber]TDG29483.1 septal ring lytic transglycosylase RlpA family lipoprotein [Paracraurococcus ruber]
METRALVCATLIMLVVVNTAQGQQPAAEGPPQASSTGVDRSGRVLRGHATVFASHLAGQRMADRGRYEPDTSIAASSSLPLGSTARVTNLRNGQTALVRIRDGVPMANGRILNVSAKVAQFLGLRRGGVFPLTVAPLAVPQSDGSIQLGAGTGLAGRRAYVTGGHDRR